MSDPVTPPPVPPPVSPAPASGRGLGQFFVVSGGIVLFLTLGCVLAFSGGSPYGLMVGLVVGSPTLVLGGLFLWLGMRRLKR
jgi:hypothetical protein